MNLPEEETVGWADLVKASGLTYRQIDHWTRKGWLRPLNPDEGSGSRRRYPAAELVVAQRMAILVAEGLTPDAAHTVARAGGTATLGGRVTVTIGAPS
jgi:DNA-binding transcriptional MerR regulator